jgi:hypothetical protein
MKLSGTKYKEFIKRLKARLAAKKAENKSRNIQHQINKK